MSRKLLPTEVLLSPVIDPNTVTLEDVFKSASGSAAGFHAISGWLTCPEQSRLHTLGVRQREGAGGEGRLSALDLGTVTHELRAIRIMHGHDAMESVLARWQSDLHPDDYTLLLIMFRTYELTFPLAVDQERFDTLGVECEVVSNIAPKGAKPIYRTVRYDTVIRVKGSSEVFSFEAKTMARSGQSSLNPYKAQAMVQCAVWNSNPALVAQYGLMRGVLFDCFVKTKIPSVDRDGPRYFGKVHTKMATDYLQLPENGGATFSVQPDGTYPKMLHACWGRWRPCEYVNLCHEDSVGEYQLRDGTPLSEVPFNLTGQTCP